MLRCSFINNTSGDKGGAIALLGNSILSIYDCIFEKNHAKDGGAIYSEMLVKSFNSMFIENSAENGGGAYFSNRGDFSGINNIFINNSASYGGAIYGKSIFTGYPAQFYLYHCTFDSNLASISGNSIYFDGDEKYSYNCLFTGETPQIDGDFMEGNNMIEGINGVTRDLVFGNNQPTAAGYIVPLPFAKSAIKLDNTIEVPVD